MRYTTSFIASIMLALALLLTTKVVAQENTDYDKLMSQAATYTEGEQPDWQTAFETYKAAFKLQTTAQASFNAGYCKLQLGKICQAVTWFQISQDTKKKADDEDPGEEQARKRARKYLGQRVGCRQVLVDAGNVAVTVWIDGENIGTTDANTGFLTSDDSYGSDREYTLKIKHEDGRGQTKTFEIKPGSDDPQKVSLTLPAKTQPVYIPPEQPNESDGDTSSTWLYWTFAGVAGAGITTAVIFGYLGSEQQKEADTWRECQENPSCTFDRKKARDAVRTGENYNVISYVSIGIATAALLGYGIVHLTEDEVTTTTTGAIELNPNGGVVTIETRW